MKRFSVFLLLVIGFSLAACGSSEVPISINYPPAAAAKSLSTQAPQQSASQDMTRSDGQGAVTFEVKPKNLDNPGNALVFEISMNTHSVDLSMDLANLATLTTDNGRSVQATSWDAPGGGHHVSGKLTFPTSEDGKSILDGATKLTLTIKDVDAPERAFTWNLLQ
jgi:predicted small lipoprotein YifL